MVTGTIIGVPRAPLALAAFAVAAAGLLLASALQRNIARWRRQAAAGQEPQSIGTAALAAWMLVGSFKAEAEKDAIYSAEGRTDALEDERIARRRREERRRQAAHGTGQGGHAAPGAQTLCFGDGSDMPSPTTTIH